MSQVINKERQVIYVCYHLYLFLCLLCTALAETWLCAERKLESKIGRE